MKRWTPWVLLAAQYACSSGETPRQEPTTPGPAPVPSPSADPNPSANPGPEPTPTGDAASPAPTTAPTSLPPITNDGPFELAWEDHFDRLDTSKWSLQTHSWDTNLAQFSTQNAKVEDGILVLSLSEAPDDPQKPYRGVEYRSRESITFGKVEASIRFAKGSAVVSSLVLIYTPWPPDDWNELDIEFLGKSTGPIQFNHMVNIPPADPISGHLQFPKMVDPGFDPGEDFHVYAIEWEPGVARFIVDGTVLHETTEEMSRMVLPQHILLTIWASSDPGWAGPVDETTAPTAAYYDWLRVYRYVAP